MPHSLTPLFIRVGFALALAVAAGIVGWELLPPSATPPERARTAQQEDGIRVVIEGAQNVSSIEGIVTSDQDDDLDRVAAGQASALAAERVPVFPDLAFGLILDGTFPVNTSVTLIRGTNLATGSDYFTSCSLTQRDNATYEATSRGSSSGKGETRIRGWKLSLPGYGDPTSRVRKVSGVSTWRVPELADRLVIICNVDDDPFLVGSTEFGTVEFPRTAVLVVGQKTLPEALFTERLVGYPLDLQTTNGVNVDGVSSGRYSFPQRKFSGEAKPPRTLGLDLTYYGRIPAEDGVDVMRYRHPASPGNIDDILGVEVSTPTRWAQLQSFAHQGDREALYLLVGTLLGLLGAVLIYILESVAQFFAGRSGRSR